MIFNFAIKNSFLCRLPHSGDLLDELNKICLEKGIAAGSISVIGAVKSARVGFYNQSEKKYEAIVFDKSLEIASCTGNISLKEGKPFAHLHITLSDRDGSVYGGHLMPGTIIFAAEAHIQSFEGEAPVRERDEGTGLPLWKTGE